MYIPGSITLLNCQCDVFLPYVAIIITAFLKKAAATEATGIRLHDGELEHSLMREEKDVNMFFFPFLCTGFPYLALGISKMLFRDANSYLRYNTTNSLLICSCHYKTLSQFLQ